jgi:hypothetical protein
MERSSASPLYAANQLLGADLAQRMLTYGFFGPMVEARFTLPRIVTPPQEFFDLFRESVGGNPWGLYYPGTNMIIISPQAPDEASRREVMLHEMLHYSAFLGGGGQAIRWRDDRGQPVTLASVWLDEGLTQYHTKEILAMAGLNPGTVTYAAETLVAFHLQNIAGAETLRRAYLTGDFTEVREEVDRQLGQYAFDTLMRQGTASDALATMRTMMAGTGINYAALETGQIAGPAADILRRQGIS